MCIYICVCVCVYIYIYIYIYIYTQYTVYTIQYILNISFIGGAVVKSPPDNAGDARDVSSILWSGRSPGKENSNQLLGNSMNRRAWQTTVHGVTKSRT